MQRAGCVGSSEGGPVAAISMPREGVNLCTQGSARRVWSRVFPARRLLSFRRPRQAVPGAGLEGGESPGRSSVTYTSGRPSLHSPRSLSFASGRPRTYTRGSRDFSAASFGTQFLRFPFARAARTFNTAELNSLRPPFPGVNLRTPKIFAALVLLIRYVTQRTSRKHYPHPRYCVASTSLLRAALVSLNLEKKVRFDSRWVDRGRGFAIVHVCWFFKNNCENYRV